MSETQAPRVWIAGNPEPSDVRLRVRDKHGDIWTPEQVLGGVRAWSTPETALATWDYLAKKWGPLTEVIASSLGVSGEDRSEPTPAPRKPRVWRDREGDIWQEGADGHLRLAEQDGRPVTFHRPWCPRGEIESLWGPLAEVVSPEGTS